MNRRQPRSDEDSSYFDLRFPTIARWVSQEEGWVEVGGDDYSNSIVRALHGGGMVWEGAEDYESLDEALTAMDAGIAAWLAENRPTGLREKLKSQSKSSRVARKPVSTAPAKEVPALKGKTPASSEVTGGNNRGPRGASHAVPRAVIGKVRKFAEIAAALRAGENFNITRLTGIKSLCKEPESARAFALFLASAARRMIEAKDVPVRYKELMDRAIPAMRSLFDDASQARKQGISALLHEIEREQNEHRKVHWTEVRTIHSMELLVVENSLKAILRPAEASFWLYQAARNYAERYDPRYGTGLIPSSAPMMQEIADFWRDYFHVVE